MNKNDMYIYIYMIIYVHMLIYANQIQSIIKRFR